MGARIVWSMIVAAVISVPLAWATLAFGATQRPVAIVTLEVEASELDALLEGVRQFGDENAFAVRVSQSSPDPLDALVQMWREDIKVIGVNVSDTGAEKVRLGIAFYHNNRERIPESAIRRVAEKLVLALKGIPSISITEE